MNDAPPLLLQDVEVAGRVVDVTVLDGCITSIEPTGGPIPKGSELIAGKQGALLPGLHDHHLHLLAMAAARTSVAVGPPQVQDRAGLHRALGAALPSADGWIRGVGYHESVAGPLDRWLLDELVVDRPVRVQHRSGAAWFLSSSGLERLGLDASSDVEGLERDGAGALTGRVFGNDLAVRSSGPVPDLAPIGRALAACGVTGVTDATPYADLAGFAPLTAAVEAGHLPQHVVVTGGPALAEIAPPDGLLLGPVKLVVGDHELPTVSDLRQGIARAHRHGRSVAIHCVTRVGLILALVAWDQVGARPGDRVEHASVAPPELRAHMARLGLIVVTQPGFVAERGDQYLTDVEADDVPHLYPCRSLIADGVPVGGSTDAPYSSADPWDAIRAAVERRTAAGALVGADERLAPQQAMDLFLTRSHDPGGAPRRVAVGTPADLCLLSVPLAEVLRHPTSSAVRATFVAGGRIY